MFILLSILNIIQNSQSITLIENKAYGAMAIAKQVEDSASRPQGFLKERYVCASADQRQVRCYRPLDIVPLWYNRYAYRQSLAISQTNLFT